MKTETPLTPKDFLFNYPENEDNLRIVLRPKQWEILHNWMDEYANEKHSEQTSQLKEQLAVSERLKNMYDRTAQALEMSNDSLKNKLAEKEKELSEVKEAYQLSCEVLEKFKHNK